MTDDNHIQLLEQLDYLSYLNSEGEIPNELSGKIGVYAIFDQDKILQFIGYSRDMGLSLRQHLVRQPQKCYWLKVQIILRPSRTLLEEIKQAWISENQVTSLGNASEEKAWTQPIDAKLMMTPEDKTLYENTDEMGKIKLLKQVSRRVEESLQSQLKTRGVREDLRFNPKLKEQGLLDLK